MKTPDVSKSAGMKLALTRKEAAAALGVSPVTIDRLTQRGILNPSRATRRPLFAVSELQRFLTETQTNSNPPMPSAFPAAAASAADSQRATTNQKEGTAWSEENRGASAPLRQ